MNIQPARAIGQALCITAALPCAVPRILSSMKYIFLLIFNMVLNYEHPGSFLKSYVLFAWSQG